MNTIKIDSGNVKIIAHRGLSGLEKENTNAAFIAAGNRSYFGIETDVHITKDKKFVIIHDETTERVSCEKCNYNVAESSFAELSDIILPDIDGSTSRCDIRIPLVEEYVNICKKYEKICVLELKTHFDENDLTKLIEIIKKLEYIENVIFISFDFENCLMVRELLPENRVQWLTSRNDIDEDTINNLIKNRMDIDIYYKVLTSDMIEKLHSRGVLINCWTCDNKEDAEKLIELGVDFITTNRLE